MAVWQQLTLNSPPGPFIEAVRDLHPQAGRITAQLLWQRGWRDLKAIESFLFPQKFIPTSPGAFAEMPQALARLHQAWEQGEKVAIWGDFDADGVTATAVLWEGLGQFFTQAQQLRYYIPNRFTESHGLSAAGLAQLQAEGCQLVITCDTGSGNLAEIQLAQSLGLDVIITDHHTLPPTRPPVVAMLNPREFSDEHPLRYLSGVAVAYKLIEALYEQYPEIPQQPLESYLDLVAIGLIADLVELKGDCRYLAQVGIEQLQKRHRPGLVALLQNARKKGNRPTDISFGLGPRINAVSRVYGDARLCLELLTTRDPAKAKELAQAAELANDRRKALQQAIIDQAEQEIRQLDLSTTYVIVLMQPQWSVGLVGVAAGQLAQKYGRPVILLRGVGVDDSGGMEASALTPEMAALVSNSGQQGGETGLAIGSARSVGGLDLYELMHPHRDLFQRFGGHPFAAGLSLPVENVPLLREILNQALGQQLGGNPPPTPTLIIDLDVQVQDLDFDLFRECKLLEPHGLGNPPIRLRLQGVELVDRWSQNLRDTQGKSQQYKYVSFKVRDPNSGKTFPAIWWGHQRADLPTGLVDLVAELTLNTSQEQLSLQINDLHPAPYLNLAGQSQAGLKILDYRDRPTPPLPQPVLTLDNPPQTWREWRQWLHQAQQAQTPLALIYNQPELIPPSLAWQRLVGMTKYLSRCKVSLPLGELQAALGFSQTTLYRGLDSLTELGVQLHIQAKARPSPLLTCEYPGELQLNPQAVADFIRAVAEEQFRRQYLAQVPTPTLQQVAQELGSIETAPRPPGLSV